MNAVEKTILMDNVSTSKSSKRRAKNRKQSQQNQNKANNHHPNKEHETNLKVENDNGESEQIVHQKLIDFLDVRTKGRLEDHNHILTQYQDLCTQKAREDINELSRNYISVLNDCNDTGVDTGSAIKSKPRDPEAKPCNRSKNSKKGNKSSLSNGPTVGSSLQIQGNSIDTNILSKNVFCPIKDNVEDSSYYHESCCCSNGDVTQTKSAESSPHSNSSCSCSSGNSIICNKSNTNKKNERKKSKLKNSKTATTKTSSETLTEVNDTSSQVNASTTSKEFENISNFCSTSMNGHSNDCNDSLSDVSCEGAVGYGPGTDHDYEKCSFYDAKRNNGTNFSEENCDGKLKNGTLLDNSSSGDGDNVEVINKFNNNVSNENNSASHCDTNDNVPVENTSTVKSLEMKADQEERNEEKIEMLPEIVSPENSSLAPISIEDYRREDGSLDPSKVVIEYKEYESELQMQDIMRLIQKELSEPYSIYTYRYFIYNWPKLCFLAAHGNEYVGAIVCKLDMHMNVKRGYIAMLAVKKEYRKMKIGTNLVQKAIEAMLADDAAEVVLETEMKNIPALRLYENLGFVRDKRLFRYYLNGVDALRLKLWFR